MGMEVSDACINKEPDGIIIYTNGIMQDSVKQTSSNHHDDVKLREHTHTFVEPCIDQENVEVKECVEKHCIEISDFEAINCDKKVGKMLPKEKLNSRTGNGKKLKILLKHDVPRASDANSRPNCTIPQPFDLATSRRASYSARIHSYEADSCATFKLLPVKAEETQTLSSTQRNQLLSLFVSRKCTQSVNKKLPDDDVAYFLSASKRPTKHKMAVVSAPAFRSTERAEKRKEFNSKLEEKHQALETKKLQSEERTKEETEAAIKQLRKSMIFKASPMPKFYHESSSFKLELKKPPPTPARSPQNCRRKSCSDADGPEDKLKSESERGSRRHTLALSATKMTVL